MDDPAHTTMRLIGIDPGLNITGYGLIQVTHRTVEVIEAGVLRTRPKTALTDRLLELHNGLQEVLQQHQPDLLAIEELYSHYERPRTAILMGHARGVLCLCAAQHSIPIHHYAATQVKRVLTGNGRAPKEQVQWAVCRELQLNSIPDPPDVADALAIALCHFHMNKREIQIT